MKQVNEVFKTLAIMMGGAVQISAISHSCFEEDLCSNQTDRKLRARFRPFTKLLYSSKMRAGTAQKSA